MDRKPTNNLIFKKVFTYKGNEDILLGFVEDIAGEKFIEVKPEVPYNIDTFKESKISMTEADLIAITDRGEHVTIEMQVGKHDFFLERTLYYACEANRREYKNIKKYLVANNRYSSLRNVYGIFITDFDLFKDVHEEEFSAVNIFEFKERKSNYLLRKVDNMGVITLIYFSLTNPNIDREIIKYWRAFFKGEKIPEDAPEYIHKAKAEADYNNLTKEERKMLERAEERQALIVELL